MKSIKIFSLVIVMLCSLSLSDLWAAEKNIHEKVDELMLSKKFKEAEKLALKAYKKNQNDALTICALACVYRNMSVEEAVIINSTAAGLKLNESGSFPIDKDNVDKIFNTEMTYDREKFKKAEKFYYEILEKDPLYVNAYFNLMNSYIVLNENDNFFNVIDLFIDNRDKLQHVPDVLNEQAGKLADKKKYDDAIRLYRIILKNYPDYICAHSDIGAVYARQGEFIKAKKIFESVYQKNENDLLNIKNYWFSAIVTEDFDTAQKLSLELIKKDPEEHFHLYKAGLLSYFQGNNYKSYFSNFIQKQKEKAKDPDNDDWVIAANEFMVLKSKKKDDQVDFLCAHLDDLSKSNYVDMPLIIGNIINSIELNNFSIMVLASIYDKLQAPEMMIKYLGIIKERMVNEPSIMKEYDFNYNIGRAFFLKKDYQTALMHLEKNLKNRKDDAPLNYTIARCYQELGDEKNAAKYYTINKNLDDKDQLEYINYSINELRKMGK